jgi:peptidoglycan/LPS O-acetylase OafA/YrhL
MKNDKKQHFIAGLLVTLFVAMPMYYMSKYNLACGLYSALYVGVITAAVKEYTDYQHVKTWDWRDFGCTCLGAVIVVLLILGLHYGKG